MLVGVHNENLDGLGGLYVQVHGGEQRGMAPATTELSLGHTEMNKKWQSAKC